MPPAPALAVGRPTAVATAESQAGTDVGWMDKGDVRHFGHGDHRQRRGGDLPLQLPRNLHKVTVTYQLQPDPCSPAARLWASLRRRRLVDQRPPVQLTWASHFVVQEISTAPTQG